ncbi:ribonuclease H superfamily polynucleotidyl transferase, putative [Medicago truncatula]|uniref:Polynucleotidyl transferase, Ribonuclease H fold n=1 Tax=Medicago truncatula TaxID=3880 RepID=A2Q653_MEDTR|nr:Polynucleotidyl transferase, Ribonuclease H fold [Medicago truncatula]AES66814.1 ribonuclease H superfamily polynucleotidyl transferase, putative [Medicago truncatula]
MSRPICIHSKYTNYIGWKWAQEERVKFNADGAYKYKGVIATCGGLLYDSYERWIKCYIRKIGPYDDLHAEMWGLYIGLDML